MIFADVPVGWAFIAAYGLIFIWLWGNWKVPGLQIASVGIAANMVAVIINAGQMPIWSAAYDAAGFAPGAIANDPFHFLLQTDTVADFVARGGLFGDVIPLPVPIIRDVVSIGDILLALGIFWAIVYSMTRTDAVSRGAYAIGPTSIMRAATATPGTAGAAYAESGSIPADLSEAGAEAAGLRRQSPYLRLFANRNFSLLWTGQLISLIGDRIHVIALGTLVATRGTALEVGITFAMTAVPSVFLGPLAGVLVDRWDRRRTMIACDVIRSVLVLLVPLAIEVHIGFVYAIAFAIATVTLLFRPAKTAIIPAVVGDRDLVVANSALSVPETAADLIGFPIAGMIVTALSAVLGAAFVLDAGTYVVSAVLLWAMILPRQVAEAVERISFRAVWREIGGGLPVPVAPAGAALEHAGLDGRAGRRRRRDRRPDPVRADRGRPRRGELRVVLRAAAHGHRRRQRAGRDHGRHTRRSPAEGADGDRRLHRHGPVARPGRPHDRSDRRDHRLLPLRRLQHGLHHPDGHALPGADPAATDGPRRLEPAGAGVRLDRRLDGAVGLPRRGHRSSAGARHRRCRLRGGRRDRHPHPTDAPDAR